METTQKKAIQKKASHVYDTETMTVVAFGGYKFAYWRFPIETIPDHPAKKELLEFALKGFIDDLQDCTTSIKKADYAKTPEGEDSYRVDCLAKRRELEAHINAGTRPTRANENPEAKADKALGKAVKEASKVVSLEGLLTKKALSTMPGGAPFTAEDQTKLDEFMMIALQSMNK